MKTTILALLVLYFNAGFSQDILGKWSGTLKVGNVSLKIVFNISEIESSLKSTMDSPDQGVYNISVSSTKYENKILKITVSSLRIEFVGTLNDKDKLVGIFKQSGQALPLTLAKNPSNEVRRKKYQEPEKPYPYLVEEIVFRNEKDGIDLKGTLTLPNNRKKKVPVAILIAGSGPQNRDEEVFGHKPFLVLADYLAKKGVATLRFDKRGVNLSTGNFSTATTADFSSDASCAYEYLLKRMDIDKKKIGLVGHSEGGLIASIIASHTQDIAFVVLLAAPGLKGDKLLLLQQEKLLRASMFNEEYIKKIQAINSRAFEIASKSVDSIQLKVELIDFFTKSMSDSLNKLLLPRGMDLEIFITRQVKEVSSPWMMYFLKYDPVPSLKRVKCPVLALNGDLDLQVPQVNLSVVKNALNEGGNKRVVTKTLPLHNHLFQECETGLPNEYALLEQTISPTALHEITSWIHSVLKK
jgi:dipeptidyl aminopeptidase/acylaminoacyl peptidase